MEMVMEEGLEEDYEDDGSMQCTNHHPNKNKNKTGGGGGGGICAFCLQDKLGRLVSSSSSQTPIFPSISSSSPSPSFGSHHFTPPVFSNLPSKPPLRSSSTLTTQKRTFWSYFHKNSSPKLTSHCSDYASPDNNNNNNVCFDNKVSRSRSVGCGSRSFSGDFFERIVGECALRRVESQREGKHGGGGGGGGGVIRERGKCGGLFGGYKLSATSSYWISTIAEDNGSAAVVGHGRNKSWAWALASPIRALKPSGKIDGGRNKNGGANLGAIPSLLAV